MAPTERTHKLTVRVAASELVMVNALADHAGLSASDIVRQLIRREHDTVLGKSPKPTRKGRMTS